MLTLRELVFAFRPALKSIPPRGMQTYGGNALDSRIVAPACVVEYYDSLIASAAGRDVGELPAARSIADCLALLDGMPQEEGPGAVNLVLHGAYSRLRELKLLWESNVFPSVDETTQPYAFRAWLLMGGLVDSTFNLLPVGYRVRDNELLAHYGRGSVAWKAYWCVQFVVDAVMAALLRGEFEGLSEIPATLLACVDAEQLRQIEAVA